MFISLFNSNFQSFTLETEMIGQIKKSIIGYLLRRCCKNVHCTFSVSMNDVDSRWNQIRWDLVQVTSKQLYPGCGCGCGWNRTMLPQSKCCCFSFCYLKFSTGHNYFFVSLKNISFCSSAHKEAWKARKKTRKRKKVGNGEKKNVRFLLINVKVLLLIKDGTEKLRNI